MKVDHCSRVKTFVPSTKTNLACNNKAKPNHLSVASKQKQGGEFLAKVSRAVRSWAENGILNSLNLSKPQAKTGLPSEAKEEIARLQGQVDKLKQALALSSVPIDFLKYIELQEKLAVSQTNVIELIKQLQALPEEATRNYAGLQKQFSELERAYANIQELYAFSQEELAELLFQVSQQKHLFERSAEVSLNAMHFARDVKIFLEAVLDREDVSPELREAFQQLKATVQNYDVEILNLHLDIGTDDNNGNGRTPEDFSQN